MKWLISIALMITASEAIAAAPTVQDLGTLPSQSRDAAIKSLQTLQEFVNSENAGNLGLTAPDELKQASLGQPLLDFTIWLDELREYKGQDPTLLLHSTGQVIYPITVKGQTRSSITLHQEKDTWRMVVLGGSGLSQARARVQDSVARQAAVGAADTFQVRIPALNAVFVAYRADGMLMFTPVVDVEGIEAGRTIPARDILDRLQQIAREIDPYVPR